MIVADYARFNARGIIRLVDMRSRTRAILLVEIDAHVPGAAVGDIFRCDQRLIKPRSQRRSSVRCRSDAEGRELRKISDQRVERTPVGAVIKQKRRVAFHINSPARFRRKKRPFAGEKSCDLPRRACKDACRRVADEQPRAFRRRCRRARRISGRNGEVSHGVEQKQGFVMRDVFLRLRRLDQRQGQMRCRHAGSYCTGSVSVSGKPRPTVGLSWKSETSSVDRIAPKSEISSAAG